MACMLAFRHNLLTNGCLSKEYKKLLARLFTKKAFRIPEGSLYGG